MNKKEVYESIVSSFATKHSWLGEQVATEFLLSVATWNIQHYQRPEFRIASNKLFYWDRGWIKSSLMHMLYNLLDDRLAIMITDITRPAFRGSVEETSSGAQFVPPLPALYPFIFIAELGSITMKKDEIVQEMLETMESGYGSTRLIKNARLSDVDRKNITDQWPWIKFKDSATITYKADAVYFGATYKAGYITDEAFAERFEAIIPNQPLTSQLTKWSDRHGFVIDQEAKAKLNEYIAAPAQALPEPNLPDSLYDKDKFMSHRLARNIRAYIMAKQWWGFKTDNEEAFDRYQKMKEGQKRIAMYESDKIAEFLKQHGKATLEEIETELRIPISKIRKDLHEHIDAKKIVENGVVYYTLL